MKNAVVCIAKNEDLYIDEWMNYHFKLGFGEIWVYQNDWRYSGPFKNDPRVRLVEFDGPNMQLKAYNDFLGNRSDGFGFAAFFDVDEYMCLKPGFKLDGFLSSFSGMAGIALNWRLFGDSGLAGPEKGDYSCVNRFVMRQKGFNKHVKTIANIGRLAPGTAFVTPHSLNVSYACDCVASASRTRWVRGPFNEGESDPPAWLNHYFCKTREEFERIKRPKGRADMPRGVPGQIRSVSAFDEHNFNDEEDLTAKNFFAGDIL